MFHGCSSSRQTGLTGSWFYVIMTYFVQVAQGIPIIQLNKIVTGKKCFFTQSLHVHTELTIFLETVILVNNHINIFILCFRLLANYEEHKRNFIRSP